MVDELLQCLLLVFLHFCEVFLVKELLVGINEINEELVHHYAVKEFIEVEMDLASGLIRALFELFLHLVYVLQHLVEKVGLVN